MKLGPVTRLDKRNKTTYKKFEDDAMPANCDVMSFFRFTAKLELSGTGFQSVKLTLSLKVTFYLTKTETRT